MRILILFCALGSITSSITLSQRAAAFPEMTRHGYMQCASCHVSPNGGGVLNQYGRQISEELLSTWSYKREGQVLHGALKNDPGDKGILFGGDVRSIQTHRKTPAAKDGRFFLMQANLDLAYQMEKVAFVISVGQIENPTSGRFEGNLNSTKYYGLLNITETVAVRAGRFTPQFGLNMPDHILVTKQGLGLQPWMQYDTVEASYLSEAWSLFAGVSKTIESTPSVFKENALNLHAMYNFNERYKVGASHWHGEGDANLRRITGVNAILGFTHHLYNLTEVDFVHDAKRDGMFVMSRLGYEVYKGVIPYAQYQRQHTNLEDNGAIASYYTIGSHFYPRPHLEVSGQWTKVSSVKAGVGEWSDEANLLFHYYF